VASCLVPRHPDPAITALARRELGFVPGVLNYLGACPWLARAEIEFHASRPIHLTSRICELVPYAVALDRGAVHLIGSLASFLRLAGYSPHELRAIERGTFDQFARPEAAALEHAVAVARGDGANTLPQLSAAGFAQAAQRELTALAALVVFGSYVTIPLGVPPDPIEAFERSLVAKLLRPLIRRRINAIRAKRSAVRDDLEHGELFPDLIATLAGSPLRPLCRDALAAAWQSGALSAADKSAVMAEVFGVLAPVLLKSLRDLSARTAASPRETLLRDYARATSVGTPDAIHAQARQLASSLSKPQLVELVGIAALANAVARLTILLDR
jgi:alkylhydroperoxidase family enzyme